MDIRLSLLGGRRVRSLRRQDLPELARAMTAYLRKQAQVSPVSIRGVQAIRFFGPTTNIAVLKSDWLKLWPYVVNGTFNPLLTKTSAEYGYLDPNTHYDVSIIDVNDRPLYISVLYVLEIVFKDSFPTSNI